MRPRMSRPAIASENGTSSPAGVRCAYSSRSNASFMAASSSGEPMDSSAAPGSSSSAIRGCTPEPAPRPTRGRPSPARRAGCGGGASDAAAARRTCRDRRRAPSWPRPTGPRAATRRRGPRPSGRCARAARGSRRPTGRSAGRPGRIGSRPVPCGRALGRRPSQRRCRTPAPIAHGSPTWPDSISAVTARAAPTTPCTAGPSGAGQGTSITCSSIGLVRSDRRAASAAVRPPPRRRHRCRPRRIHGSAGSRRPRGRPRARRPTGPRPRRWPARAAPRGTPTARGRSSGSGPTSARSRSGPAWPG